MPEAGVDLAGNGFISTLMDSEVGRAHMLSANGNLGLIRATVVHGR